MAGLGAGAVALTGEFWFASLVLKLSGAGFGFHGHGSGLSGWGELSVGVGPADAGIGTSGDLDGDTAGGGFPWGLAIPDDRVNDKAGGVDYGVDHWGHHSRIMTTPAAGLLPEAPPLP